MIRLILFFLLITVSAHAATLPAPVAAVLDVQRVLQDSLAAQSIQKQIDGQRLKFENQIEAEENTLRQAEENLTQSRAKMAGDVYADREQELRQKFLTVERDVQARRKALDVAYTEAINTVRENLLILAQDIAHQHGANIVLVKQQVLWADKALDITDEVLSGLNKKMKDVPVTILLPKGA